MTTVPSHYLRIALIAALTALAACSDSSNSDRGTVEPPEPEAVPFQELYDQGVDRYLGEFTPMLSETDGDIVNHKFGAGDGPLCLRGGEYTMATKDNGSDELVIYLQGGGACWSDFCAATEEAAPGITEFGFRIHPIGNGHGLV